MPILQGELTFEQFVANLPRMPHQHKFLTAPFHSIAYVGGVGSGKSATLMGGAIATAMADPHGFSLVGRLNMPALESSTMRTFLEMVPDATGQWHDTKKMYTWGNGHTTVFRHLDISDPKVAGHIRSMNLSAMFVDELTEVSEEVYFLGISRLRRKLHRDSLLQFRPFRGSSNPNGTDWAWRLFFDPDRKPELRRTNLGITARTQDNVFLPPEYVENMLNTYPPDWAERFIYGSFADFSDLVYKEFTDRTHVWDPRTGHAVFGGSNNPPESWPVIVGIDIGSDADHDPWSIPVIAVAPDGRLYQYAEVYGNNMLIAEIAAQLKPHIEGRKIAGVAYDYSNRQCALELADHGINGTPAIKEVHPGLLKVSQYMHIDPSLEHPFNPLVKGSPRFFMSSACVNSYRELAAYKWGKDRSGKPTGEPSHDSSHSPDGVRYAIHTFRPTPVKERQPKAWENAKLDPLSREYWKGQDKVTDRMVRFAPKERVQRTIKQWQEIAEKGPVRFKKPNYVGFRRH